MPHLLLETCVLNTKEQTRAVQQLKKRYRLQVLTLTYAIYLCKKAVDSARTVKWNYDPLNSEQSAPWNFAESLKTVLRHMLTAGPHSQNRSILYLPLIL